jgi:hypothetical protein
MSSFMESQTERCPRKEYFGALRASPAGSLLKPLFHFSCLSKSSHQSPIPRGLEARFACLPNIGSHHLLPFLSSPMFFLSPLSHIDRYRSFSTRCHRQLKPPESSQHCSSQEEVQHTQIYSDKGQSGHFRAGIAGASSPACFTSTSSSYCAPSPSDVPPDPTGRTTSHTTPP